MDSAAVACGVVQEDAVQRGEAAARPHPDGASVLPGRGGGVVTYLLGRAKKERKDQRHNTAFALQDAGGEGGSLTYAVTGVIATEHTVRHTSRTAVHVKPGAILRVPNATTF